MLLIAKDNLVCVWVFRYNKLRLAKGDTQSLSLTDGIALMAEMFAKCFTVYIHIFTFWESRTLLCLNKFGIISVWNKANILTILSRGRG